MEDAKQDATVSNAGNVANIEELQLQLQEAKLQVSRGGKGSTGGG